MNGGARTAVLFVHGIQGSPRQFRFLAEALPPDVLVRAPLLPGHGGSVRPFLRSRAEDWLRCVRREALALHRQGARILYVGHSMGCLLGLLAARETEISFARQLFLCCPFRIRPTPRYVRNFIRPLLSDRPSDDPFVRASRAANSVHAAAPAGYLGCIPPYLELFRLMRRVGRQEPPAPDPVSFYFSALDEIVSPRSHAIAEGCPGASVRLLPGCGHNYFTHNARQLLRDRLLELAAEVSGEAL